MSIFFEVGQTGIIVSGKTFNCKDRIKSLGAKFNFNEKIWILPHTVETLAGITALCAEFGGGQIGVQNKTQSATEPTIQRATKQTGVGRPLGSGGLIDPTALGFPALEPIDAARQESAVSEWGSSISQILERARAAISGAFPRPEWVIGEIQNLSERRGSFFLSLAEAKQNAADTATITVNATLWAGAVAGITSKHGKDAFTQVMAEGLQGRFLCQPTLFRDRGSLSLNILDLDPNFTKGALALARETLLKELRQKGLDQLNKQQPLSPFPLTVGLISAEGSRAHSDFIHQLWSYKFPGQVLFCKASMQGEKVPQEVCSGIKSLQDVCDIIVITRGGGSAADLRWFDGKDIALAIARCPVPVIAAIGHHDDVCIAEEVCFRREKTPTAAADFLVHLIQRTRDELRRASALFNDRLRQQIERCIEQQGSIRASLAQAIHQGCYYHGEFLYQQTQKLRLLARRNIDHATRQVSHANRQLAIQSQASIHAADRMNMQIYSDLKMRSTQQIQHHVERLRGFKKDLKQHSEKVIAGELFRTVGLKQSLTFAGKQTLDGMLMVITSLRSQLVGVDPIPWLTKGWTQLWHGNVPIKSIVDLKVNTKLSARLVDGVIDLKVQKISERTKQS